MENLIHKSILRFLACLLLTFFIFSSLIKVRSAEANCDTNQYLVIVTPFLSVDPQLIQYIKSFRCQTIVFNDFSETDDIKINGNRLYQFLLRLNSLLVLNKQIESEKSVEFIAHGIGGLYLLSALGEKQDDLPQLNMKIKKINLLNTPLKGIEFADLLALNPTISNQLKKYLVQSFPHFNINPYWNLTTEQLEVFINRLNRIIETPVHLFLIKPNIHDENHKNRSYVSSINMPNPLAAVTFLSDTENDGVINLNSINISITNDLRLQSMIPHLFIEKNLNIPLNHIYFFANIDDLKELSENDKNKVSFWQKRLFLNILN